MLNISFNGTKINKVMKTINNIRLKQHQSMWQLARVIEGVSAYITSVERNTFNPLSGDGGTKV